MENQTKEVKEIKQSILRMIQRINSREDLERILNLARYIFYKK